MRITHICLLAPVTDGWSYQDNLLSKYHRKAGHDVTIITSMWVWGTDGKLIRDERSNYTNENDVRVVRLEMYGKDSFSRKFKRFHDLYLSIEETEPDILFIHGVSFRDTGVIAKYLSSHPNVVAYADNHADYSNSGTNWISKNILHKIIWKHYARKLFPYVRKFYGVLPARVGFLTDCYGVPSEKCELLVMGADDELVEETKRLNKREKVRRAYEVSDDDFLIATGGKINKYRPEVLNLIKAVININERMSNVKLLFFGTATEDYKKEFDHLCAHPCIINVGWVKSDETYDYIEAADLVVFPGLHSVTWEQAVAQGKPCMFRDISGFDHVDVGGNALFLRDVSVDGIRTSLKTIIENRELYTRMKSVAEEKGATVFSYKDIARRSIDSRDNIS